MLSVLKKFRGLLHEPSRQWFQEFSTYHHGLTWWEFWVRYTLARDCFNDVRATDGEREAFNTDWPLYRQTWRNRNRTWYDVLRHMHRYEFCDQARILDFGCGNGDMAVWLAKRKPWWDWTLVDLKTPHRDYAEWRMLRALEGQEWNLHVQDWITYAPWTGVCVITCYETFEHLEQPLLTARDLVSHLVPGGIMLWDFEDAPHGANIYPIEERQQVLALLNAQHDGHGEVYRKPG